MKYNISEFLCRNFNGKCACKFLAGQKWETSGDIGSGSYVPQILDAVKSVRRRRYGRFIKMATKEYESVVKEQKLENRRGRKKEREGMEQRIKRTWKRRRWEWRQWTKKQKWERRKRRENERENEEKIKKWSKNKKGKKMENEERKETKNIT